ncbi:MAG: Nif3-like dinuclear metal center hexameric protein [Nitrospinota bacterium]
MRRVIRLCEKLSPPALAAEWDNVGLIIGDLSARVKGVLVALDVTEEAIEAAVKQNCNLMVVHHPPILAPIKKIDVKNPLGRLIKSLLTRDISVYVMHTNLDSAPRGLNHHVARMIGLKKIRPVTSSGITYRIGELPADKGAREFAALVKKRLGISSVRLYGNVRAVKKIAVCTGSGGELLTDAAAKGADALITGDVKHHQALVSRQLGLCLLDAGHFGTERPMVELAAGFLKKHLTNGSKRINIRVFHSEEPFEEL